MDGVTIHDDFVEKKIEHYLLVIRVQVGVHYMGCECESDDCKVVSITEHSRHIVQVYCSRGRYSYLPRL